jgi:hypothetical protein
MKKVFLFLALFMSFAFSVFAESIKNYQVNIKLQKDSSMLVEEKIDYDFGQNQRHGIERFIPIYFNVKGQEKKGERRKIEISQLKVLRDGVNENITTKNEHDSNNNYFLRIGRKDKTISGLHQYIIKYKVEGSLRYFDDFDEIYWNATGLD